MQADETGWREDGLNGYVWSVCPPTLRYYEYHHSRAGGVVKRFLQELFVFVASPGVPSDNNLAERSVRPLVIARNISGGTRRPT